jgi:hypothetical protein
MLADVCVELEDPVCGGLLVGALSRGAIFAFCRFGHFRRFDLAWADDFDNFFFGVVLRKSQGGAELLGGDYHFFLEGFKAD